MAFVVDGAEWCFDHWTEASVEAALDEFLERVETARERNETVWVGDDLQTRSVLAAFDLWQLWSPDSPIRLRAEIGHELAAWLGSAPRYLDEDVWPDGIEDTNIRVDGNAASENCDVAWAHHHVRAGRAIACLSLGRIGPHETSSSHGDAVVHWIKDEATHVAFWRDAIDLERDTEETLERLGPHAFPNLYFPQGVWNGLRRFDGGYQAVRLTIRRYLTILDEYGSWAFTFPPPALSPGEAAGSDFNASPSKQIVRRRFSGLALTMEPENPDVRADTTCREAREITIGGRTLYCEWHAKLEPHRNRIHVHAPVAESNDRVIIAIFAEHLPLP